MSPREREQVGPVPEDPEEEPNRGGDPRDFLRLVSEARGASDEERARLVGELNDVLVAMRAPGNERAEARAVLGQLDLKSLTGLIDDRGRAARAEAVQTVLTLGFPYALEVSPADLEFAREKERTDAKATVSPEGLATLDKARKAAAVVAGLSAIAQGIVLTQNLGDVDATVLTAATATATAGWALWVANRVGNLKRDLVQGGLGLWLALGTFFVGTASGASPVIAGLAALPLFGAIGVLSASRAASKDRER